MPNTAQKHVSDLTELEQLRLGFARERVKFSALDYAMRPTNENLSNLLCDAHDFGDLCNEVGLSHYWHVVMAPLAKCCSD